MNPNPWLFPGDNNDQQSAGPFTPSILPVGSQDVTPTSEDVTARVMPSITDSESSQDITQPYMSHVTSHEEHPASQDVTTNIFSTPTTSVHSDEFTQPHMMLESSNNEFSQDVTCEPTETIKFSAPNMTENSASALNNSDMTTTNKAILTVMMVALQELPALSHEPLAPSSQDVTSSAIVSSTDNTIDITPLELNHSIDNTHDRRHPIPPETDVALDSDDTIIIIQPEHFDSMDQSANDNKDASETSVSPNDTLSSKQYALNERTKKFLALVGISEALYRANANAYYMIYPPKEDDVEHISSLSILESSCSVSTMNLSAEQIEFEKTALKASSPSPDSPNANGTGNIGVVESSSDIETEDDERDDSTFGTSVDPKCKPKASNRPRWVPSAARIVAQKLVVKTKGLKPSSTLKVKLPKVTKPKPRPHRERTDDDTTNTDGNTTSKPPPSVIMKPDISTAAESRETKFLSVTNRKMGLRVTHHGLIHHSPTIKRHRFQCEMCRNYFMGSTKYINHYKETHLALPCTNCEKVFMHPLSLKKHNYHHQENVKTCKHCGWSFSFDCQLNDHLKMHLPKKLHPCSFANCDRSLTHMYDLWKHECTHTKTVLLCKDCDYKTKDVQNLRQHKCIHTGIKPYSCTKCEKCFTFYVQKK